MNVPPCSPESTEKFEVSLSKLHCNLDLLLDRDMKDCSAKNLTALIQKDYKIYINKDKTRVNEQCQNGPRCARHKEVTKSTKANADILETKNSERNVHLPSNDLSVDMNYSRRGNADCEASSFDTSKASFHEKEEYVKENKAAEGKRYSCKTVEERLLDCSHDGRKEMMLPSNGWWQRNANSDSESDSCDTDEKERETGHNSVKMKDESKESYCQTDNDSIQGFIRSKRADGGELSTTTLKRNHFPGNPDGNSPIFHLTSFAPEVASPSSLKKAEKVCTLALLSGESGYNSDNNNTSIKYFEIQSLTGEDAVLPDDLKLDYESLFAFHTSVSSRRTAREVPRKTMKCMDKIVKPPLNKAVKDTMETTSSLPSRREEMFQEYKDDNNGRKIVFVPFKQASQNSLKVAPNKPAQPVKLRMKHRRDNGTSLVSDAMLSGDETGGRLLPTTLTHSDKNSYSLMSPYMANVVWSVMKDENV